MKKYAWQSLLHRAWLTITCTCALTAAASGDTEDPHAHHRHHMQQAQQAQIDAETAVDVNLLDIALIDRDGVPKKLVSEVIGDHLVAINVMYTTCTTVCPVTSALFMKLQSALGDRMLNEIRLVSISVDPVTDTPERMQAYAEKMSAGDSWFWLTGAKPDVDAVLEGMGAYTADFRDHPPVILIGNPRTDSWRRFYGFPSPDKLIDALNAVSG